MVMYRYMVDNQYFFYGKLIFEEKNIKYKLFNFRVVEFVFYFDMKRVLDKLDETEINGRKIRLVEDKLRRSRRYGKSMYR